MAKSERAFPLNGELIRKKRLAKGWSRETLADKAEVSKKTIQNAELGKPLYPYTINQIAKQLGIDYQDALSTDVVEDDSLTLELSFKGTAGYVAKHPHVASFLELLMKMLPTPEAIKIKVLTDGLAPNRLSLALPASSATDLFQQFPDFHEHARDIIAQSPEGRAYFRGLTHPEAEKVAHLLHLVESVRELRIQTREIQDTKEEDSEPTAPSNEGRVDPPLNPNEQYALEFVDLGDLVGQLEAAKSLPGPEREARVAELEKQLDAKFAALAAWKEKQK